MLTYAAGGLTLAALITVYRSWRVQSPLVLLAGITLWVISSIWWSYAHGWEFGLLYALCLPGCLVWPFILINQSRLPAPKSIPSPRTVNFTAKTALAHLAHCVVVLALLLFVSVAITLGLCTLLPLSLTGQLALAIIMLPLLWGLIAYHYLASRKKLVVVGVYLVAAMLGMATLFFVPM